MPAPAADPANRVRVWDPAVRLFHWSLVAGFVVAWLSGEAEERGLILHVYSGYVVGGLIIFRIVWGFVGTRHARFADFVYPPQVVMAYARDLIRGNPRRYLGHNPLGGAMVVALLAMLFLAVLTGLALYGADASAGPLAQLFKPGSSFMAEWLEELHEFASNVALLLATVHVMGVAGSSYVHRENLVLAMITGVKRHPS